VFPAILVRTSDRIDLLLNRRCISCANPPTQPRHRPPPLVTHLFHKTPKMRHKIPPVLRNSHKPNPLTHARSTNRHGGASFPQIAKDAPPLFHSSPQPSQT